MEVFLYGYFYSKFDLKCLKNMNATIRARGMSVLHAREIEGAPVASLLTTVQLKLSLGSALR